MSRKPKETVFTPGPPLCVHCGKPWKDHLPPVGKCPPPTGAKA
jgi:hypothetical protein